MLHKPILKHLLVCLTLLSPLCLGAQPGRVTFSASNQPVSRVLEQIQQQSGCSFFYRDKSIDLNRKVSVSAKDEDAVSVLNRIFEGTSVAVSLVEGKNIVFSRKPVQKPVLEETPAPKESTPPAQPLRVTGTVKDSSGAPVPGTTVFEKGNTSNGVFTDFEGKFILTVPQEAVIVFSSIGYDTVEAPAAMKMDITVSESQQFLSEAVVVGYGVQKKETIVGSVSQIDNEAIVNSGLTNVTQAIAGKLSGVLTMQSSGQPGSNDATILVRGVSSWNGSSPLVMVDGVEREFQDLDPNEIATISVLKDASATAVFGAKGANGVIMVTTRTGVQSKPKMSLKVTHGLSFPTGIPEHISAYDTAEAFNVALRNNGQFSAQYSDYALSQYRSPDSELNSLRYPDVDWYDLLMRKCAHTTDANMNFSGGTDKVRYFFSMGYKNEGSIFKEYKDGAKYSYDRFNYRANLDFDITKTTLLSFRAGGNIGVQQSPNSPISAMYSTSTILFPAYYPASLMEIMPDIDYPNRKAEDRIANPEYFGSYYGNPYRNLSQPTYDQTTDTRLYTDLELKQDLGFLIQGLSIKGKFSFSTYMKRLSESVSKSLTSYGIDWSKYDIAEGNPWVASQTTTIVVEDPPYSASQGSISNYKYSLYWEGSINYDRTFNGHQVTALALFNQRESVTKVEFPYRTQGVVGRVTYNYNQKYLFEGNIGYTGSEQFAPANRFGLFPSLAVGYVVSKEEFWKKALPWWDKFKLRYSDGTVGSDNTTSRWLYISTYNTSSGGYVYESAAANATARWETARKRDLGIEMAWLRNRLSLNVDLFNEHRTDILVAPIVTVLVGVNSKEVNKGELKKHGMEIELEWEDKLPCGLGYNVTAMYSFNENRIINYEDAPYTPDYQKTAGKPHASQTYGESTVDGGYFTNVDDIHNYVSYSSNWNLVPVGGYKYLDYKADGSLDTNDMHAVFGSKYPSTLCSFGGGLHYKGFEFNFLFYGNFNKYVNYNGSFEMDFVKNDIRISKSMSDYWTPTNPNAGHATMVYRGASGHPMYTWAGITSATTADMGLEDRTWRKADYLNLRDVYMGYTFDTKKIKSITGITSMSVFMNANNLFYVTSLLEGNPEASSFVNGFYPLMRTVQLGLKVGF